MGVELSGEVDPYEVSSHLYIRKSRKEQRVSASDYKNKDFSNLSLFPRLRTVEDQVRRLRSRRGCRTAVCLSITAKGIIVLKTRSRI